MESESLNLLSAQMAGVLRTERQGFQPCSTKRMKQSEMRNDHECVRGAKLRKVDTEQSTITDEQEEMRVEKPLVVQSQGAHVLSPVHNSKKTRVTFILEKASLQKGVVGKMVSGPCQSPRRFVSHGSMFPWRLSLLNILSHSKKSSASLRRCRSRVRNRQHNRLMLKPCSKKSFMWTKGGQEDVEVTKREIVNSALLEDEMKIKEILHESPGIPMNPSGHNKKSGIIFVFEKASLVPALVGKTHQILNPDDHANFLRRKKKNPYNYRPEIIHQALLEVLDSALYKAGRVQAIYVRTEEGVLIKIEPHTNIPRTFGSFCNMMLELLQKLSIKAKGKREKLLRLVENPVTQHLPVNSYKIGLSFSSKQSVCLKEYVGDVSDDVNLVFVVGAMAHGKIDSDYTDDTISDGVGENLGRQQGGYGGWTFSWSKNGSVELWIGEGCAPFRGAKGCVLKSFCGSGSVLFQELKAIVIGLGICLDLNVRDVEVASDSLYAVQVVNRIAARQHRPWSVKTLSTPSKRILVH
ncbi:hypothetical protein IFM89_014238 [Coptis chinensis]|uniref:RNase H type-1 domain-containing protein n=1 Tax=Coptis chinensis TaxID=261450 RepID=A0A835LF26_9MAGN|nr:hypothetical protein IFM89_014238 [Coptis chinensis]